MDITVNFKGADESSDSQTSVPSCLTVTFFLCLFLCSVRLHVFFSPAAQPPQNPCQPSPCGPNSQCREINGHAVCSCLTGFVGSPPTCRPECMVSSDCAQDRACVKQKCIDPCPGTCGVNARCQVVNHNPICSCPPGFTGDPFARCIQQESKHFFSYLFLFYSLFNLKLFSI